MSFFSLRNKLVAIPLRKLWYCPEELKQIATENKRMCSWMRSKKKIRRIQESGHDIRGLEALTFKAQARTRDIQLDSQWTVFSAQESCARHGTVKVPSAGSGEMYRIAK